MSAPEDFTQDLLETRLRHLVLALAVAAIDTSVAIIEEMLAAGRPADEAVLARLAREIETRPDLGKEFRHHFGPAFEDELRAAFGSQAAVAILAGLGPACRAGELKRLAAVLPRVARNLHEPLSAFLDAQRESRRRQAELVTAIAETGLETITAFGYMDRVRDARRSMSERLDELNHAAGLATR